MPSDYQRITQDNIEWRGKGFDDIGEFLARQLYRDRTHFVYELLQNAEDALLRRVKADPQCKLPKTVAFHLHRDRLEVRHYGQVFDERDVRGVSDVLKGTKGTEPDQIGKFGIGFKSVYAFTTTPEIHSGDEHFRIERFIRPRAIPPCSARPGETVFVLPFNDPKVPTSTAIEEIGRCLKEKVTGQTLLFLRNIDCIEWHITNDCSGTYRRSEVPRGDAREVTVATETGGTSRTEKWLLFQKPVACPSASSLAPVEIAFKLGKRKLGEQDHIVRVEKSLLVVFFPTDIETRLGFLLQGPYRTTPARDNVPDDDEWNKQLVQETAKLVTESLFKLKSMNLLTVRVLEALPITKADFVLSRFHPLFSAVMNAIGSQPLLPTEDGTFTSGTEVALPGAAWLREVLGDGELQQLFPGKVARRWLTHDITEHTTRPLWDYLTDVVGVKEVSQEAFARALSAEFLGRQGDDWMRRFYTKLTDVESLWRQGSGPLRRQPIIRLESGKHVVPFSDDASRPNAYLPSVTGRNDSPACNRLQFVRRCLATDRGCREFLRRLGIPEPDVVHEVLELILPKYADDRVAVTAYEEHMEDVQKIQRAMRADSRSNRSKLEQALKDGYWVLAENRVTRTRAFKRPEQLYLSTPELELYFGGNSSAWFVCQYPSDIQVLLTSLGVAQSVRIKCKPTEDDGTVILEDYVGQHVMGVNGFDPFCEIEGLQVAIAKPSLQRAQYIWNRLLIPNWKLIYGKVLSSTRQGFPHESTTENIRFSKVGDLVANTAWIPTTSGGFQRPFQMQLTLLPEGFERDANLARLFEMRESKVEIACDNATKQRYAAALGINLDVVEAMKRNPGIIEVIKHNLPAFEKWLRDREVTQSAESEFPERSVRDAKRRAEKLEDELDEAPEKEYEDRTRRVRISGIKSDQTTWLREQYTQNDRMRCQICQLDMPFRRRDGKHYFEAVESFSDLGLEHRCLCLALCPLCAAKYKEFVKREREHDVSAQFHAAIMQASSLTVPVRLGDERAVVRFVEQHLHDLRQCLTRCAGGRPNQDGESSERTTTRESDAGSGDNTGKEVVRQDSQELKVCQADGVAQESGLRENEQVMIGGVAIARTFENVRHACKYCDGKHWILATRRGCIIARFTMEAKLDTWWIEFQRQKGRRPEPLEKGMPDTRRS